MITVSEAKRIVQISDELALIHEWRDHFNNDKTAGNVYGLRGDELTTEDRVKIKEIVMQRYDIILDEKRKMLDAALNGEESYFKKS